MGVADLVHGESRMIDHTPSGADVAAGDIVVLGSITAFAHRDIADGEPGSLGIDGGVYDVDSGGTVIGAGVNLWWTGTAVATTSATGANTFLGVSIAAAGASDTKVRIYKQAAVVS